MTCAAQQAQADLHDFVFCFEQNQNKTFFLLLQWYFDLSKQEVLILVLPKPKQNCAGQSTREKENAFNRAPSLARTEHKTCISCRQQE